MKTPFDFLTAFNKEVKKRKLPIQPVLGKLDMTWTEAFLWCDRAICIYLKEDKVFFDSYYINGYTRGNFDEVIEYGWKLIDKKLTLKNLKSL